MKHITRKDILAIAGEAQCDPRTVASIYAGEKSKTLVRERVVEAAKRLKIAVPPTEKRS